MTATTPKRNLLLAFDAFGTLFTPKETVFKQYSDVARKHGLSGFADSDVEKSFRSAFKKESKLHPNYGKAVDMGAAAWWGNVISHTFQPFLPPNQKLPPRLIPELLTRFSTKEGYKIYPDVLPFFRYLQQAKAKSPLAPDQETSWPWDQTVVGIITNSDDRVPEILRSLGLGVGTRLVGNAKARQSQANMEDDLSFVVLSYDVGVEKPDKRIFDAAKQILQEILDEKQEVAGQIFVDDFECLYVGDEWEKDYFGARNAGWNALFLDRDGKHLPKDMEELKDKIYPVTGGSSGHQSAKQGPTEAIQELGALRFWKPKAP